MSTVFKLVSARVEQAPTWRQVFDPDAVASYESLVEAVQAAGRAIASRLIPFIECDGVVFCPRHIEVLIAELGEGVVPAEEQTSPDSA